MIRLLFDTNLLIYSFDDKTDIKRLLDSSMTDSYRLYALQQCINELKTIGRRDVAAWAESYGFTILEKEDGRKADDILLEKSKQGFHIATNDKALYSKVIKHGGKAVKFSGRFISVQ
ncbi:hypothetical protein M1293_02925 [Candidatus Parvarchaeota archaeon]|nr:hypothetical protein [Candidatus Parvarchaeota archaeon]